MAQRTRWMKGWMQTYLVHNLSPLQFMREAGWRAFIGFQVLVGGMILTSLLHTIFIGSLLGRLLFAGLSGFALRDIWDWISILVLAVGYGGAVAVVISGLVHIKAWHLLAVQALLPAYWLLHSIAALRAAVELVIKPSYWAKTTHGVTRKARGETLKPRQAAAVPVKSRSG
jgi:hypothetical protein